MKSPFTGGNATKKYEYLTLSFRKEKFTVKRYYFQCNETGKTFSNTEVDSQVMNDVYRQYRERHSIPSPEQLKNLREKYGFSAHIMSKIAGIGVNQYGLYENGEMPTIVVGQKLSSLFEKESLIASIDSSRIKLGKDYGKVKEKVRSYSEPYSLSITDEYYDEFDEIQPLIFPSLVLSIRRPQWAYCNI